MASTPRVFKHGAMETHPGHRSLRKGRWSETGRVYLVTCTTRDRKPLFRDPALATAACRAISHSLPQASAAFVCWVLMPDHFHALLRLTGNTPLSRCVQRIKGRSSMACHAAMPRPAPVWSRAFHDHALHADEDLLGAARYIIANPIRAGLVEQPLGYSWWDAEWL